MSSDKVDRHTGKEEKTHHKIDRRPSLSNTNVPKWCRERHEPWCKEGRGRREVHNWQAWRRRFNPLPGQHLTPPQRPQFSPLALTRTLSSRIEVALTLQTAVDFVRNKKAVAVVVNAVNFAVADNATNFAEAFVQISHLALISQGRRAGSVFGGN